MKGLIGNTPLLQIFYKLNGEEHSFFTKLEYYNYTGSIKDRVVSYILEKSKEEGLLKEGMPLVEATSGNTGISLSSFGALLNHPVKIFMPDWVSKERDMLMRSYGADVTLISREEGGFKTCIEMAKEYALIHDGFLLNQFSNRYNLEAHEKTTAKELLLTLKDIDVFVSGIGTGGTLIGTGKKLKEVYGTKVIAMEPENMSLLKNHTYGSHKIEGIGDDFIPDIVDQSLIDDVITISDEEAIYLSQKLARDLGLGVGISSGANAAASILLHDLGETIVTVFADDNKKYLSSDLMVDMHIPSRFKELSFTDFKVVTK